MYKPMIYLAIKSITSLSILVGTTVDAYDDCLKASKFGHFNID